MKQIILTAVLTAILTSIMTAGTIYFVASRMPAQTQSQPAAEEQAPATPPTEQLAEQMAEHLAKPAEPSVAEASDPAQVVKLPITREAFEKLVIGKTKDQVLRMIGKPDSRYGDSNSKTDQWSYKEGVIDQLTGKTVWVFLIFENDIADHVTYN